MAEEKRYKVTALKWRPKQFKDVVYQDHVTTTLTNAIKTNRIAHAYLFCGPRGVGKTTIARIFARAVNCLNPQDGEPCEQCENCKLAIEGRGLDIVEIDGASNRGIDDMRSLQESARYTPSKGKYKIYIIDEIHMITREGFNAFLKTLEEPPEHIIFIGATTEPIKVYQTIISRCQRFDFRRIPVKEIIERIKFIASEENIIIDEESLLTIAKKGDGSLRDAQSIFDQVISSCGDVVSFEKLAGIMNLVSMDSYFKVTDLILQRNTKGGFELIDDIVKRGYDLHEFIIGLLDHFRNLLMTTVSSSVENLEVSEEFKTRYFNDSKKFSDGDIIRIMKVISDLEINYKYFNQPRLRFEVVLMQIIKMDKTIEIGNLLKELEDLKKKVINSPVDLKATPTDSSRSKITQFDVRPTIDIDNNTSDSKSDSPDKVFEKLSFKENKTKSLTIDDNVATDLNLEKIKSGWNALQNEIMKFNRIYLKSILSTVDFISFENRTLNFICTDPDTIKDNIKFLNERINTVYKTTFILNPEASRPQESNSIASPVETGINESIEKNHPVIQAIMREFGAEPII